MNGYVAFFDVSVFPSNSDEDDDNDEDDDDEGKEKEEKHNEERLAAFVFIFFFLTVPPHLFSVLSLAIHLFLSCSGIR